MGVVRLGICVGGVYGAFLLWAVAQERLSAPFPSTNSAIPATSTSEKTSTSPPRGDRFPSPLFLNYAQALASCLSALSYLIFNAWRSGALHRDGLWSVLGFRLLQDGWKSGPMGSAGTGLSISTTSEDRRLSVGSSTATSDSASSQSQTSMAEIVRRGSTQVEKGVLGINGSSGKERNGVGNGVHGNPTRKEQSAGVEKRSGSSARGLAAIAAPVPWRKTLPALLLQVSTLQTIAGPIGFLALRHISFPTMVLGKSCKLIPVMMLNILIYRRRFSAHKYIVVALVTAGISVFMLLAPKKHGKGEGSDSVWGLSLLLFNLFVDGLTNSTQDQIFALYPHYTGQQMMFHMSLLAQLILLPLMLLPLPSSPLSLLRHLPAPLSPNLLPSIPGAPIIFAPAAAFTSISFLFSHPTALSPLLAYALLGGLGQLFIFETIQHFGSLTLTMVTVTRKLFTMLLSVLVFEHKLSTGQWVGVGIVFAGIGVEAGVKRRDVMRKARRD